MWIRFIWTGTVLFDPFLCGPDFLNGSVLYDLRYFIWTLTVEMGQLNIRTGTVLMDQFDENWIILRRSNRKF